MSQSNESQVVIKNVGFGLAGNFSCEVTADAPLFSTGTAYSQLQVVGEFIPPASIKCRIFQSVWSIVVAPVSQSVMNSSRLLRNKLNNGFNGHFSQQCLLPKVKLYLVVQHPVMVDPFQNCQTINRLLSRSQTITSPEMFFAQTAHRQPRGRALNSR